MQERGFSSHASYSLSKLASQFFTKDLSERVKSRGLTANCLDPGTVNTKMLFAGWGPCGISIKVLFFTKSSVFLTQFCLFDPVKGAQGKSASQRKVTH